jgi:hypothetical protein
MGKGKRTLLGLLALGLAAFAWGLAAGRYQVFPFPQLQRGWQLLRGALSAPGEPGEPAADAPPGEPAASGPSGLWHKSRGAPGAQPDMQALRELADLPYLDGYQPAPDESGVTLHLPEAHAGLNLVVSGHAPAAQLLDMDGALLFEWHMAREVAWPGLDLGADPGFAAFWRRAHVLPNGELLAILDGIGMVKLDRRSRLLWANPGRYHHDLWLDQDGTIYTLARAERAAHERLELDGPIEEDFVAVLAPDGRELRRVSVLECLLNSDYAPLLALARKQGDILHTNTIERLDGRLAERHPLYARGNLLVSLPTINTVAVLDIERPTVVWALTGLWNFQHQPTVLEDGWLLVFDNGRTGDSRVLEVDPLTQSVRWSYRGTPERPFWSYFLGSSARLPNGNTLITESAAGRAFEVARDGRRVWEYVNPERGGAGDELIASLLEVVRIEPDYFDADFAAELE